MSTTTTTAAEYRQAELEHTVRESNRGFVVHARVYAVVMTGLVALNLVLVATTDADVLWFPYPLLGWGLGLANHYYRVRRIKRDLRSRQAFPTRHTGAAHRAQP